MSCLDRLNTSNINLTYEEKVTFSLMNSVYNNNEQICAFTSNTFDIFNISGNKLSIPKSLYIDRSNVLTDVLYNFTDVPPNSYPTFGSSVSKNYIPTLGTDAYYSLFRDDAQNINIYTGLSNYYTTCNIDIPKKINNLFQQKTNIELLINNTAILTSNDQNSLNNEKTELDELKKQFLNIKTQYSNLLNNFNNDVDTINEIHTLINNTINSNAEKIYEKRTYIDSNF
jgi:hypothetical protein